jgi:hypothetical protein
MQTVKTRFTLPVVIIVCALPATAVHADQSTADLPGIGESVVINEIKVTLLGAKRLAMDEYREASGHVSGDWAGGGVRLVFIVENRSGAPLPPALGEVRVFFGSELYNPVTNASSRKPFALTIIIRSEEEFFATPYGRLLALRAPRPRPLSIGGVLDILVRGGPVPDGVQGVVELEQGETYRPDPQGRLQMLTPMEMSKAWSWFRFRLPALD